MQSFPKKVFISYHESDRDWAEWMAWQLEEAGYSVHLDIWDIRPGANLVNELDKATREAERTLVVLSPEYLRTLSTHPEWTVAFKKDPTGEQGRLLPVHVRECRSELTGLLGVLAYIDLVGREEADARERFLADVRQERAKPAIAPDFPTGTHHLFPQQRPFPGGLPPLWMVPSRRNPFFVGRNRELELLHTTFVTNKTAALTQPEAISGLGGIGKTQIAIEYAYRYHDEYQAVFWIPADARERIITSFAQIAWLLDLPEKNEQDQTRLILAIKHWLDTHTAWLLIFDNVDDVAMVREFLPSTDQGHILLTTRASTVGRLARSVRIEAMGKEEGALFLLHRAKGLPLEETLESIPVDEHGVAQKLSEVMGGLPLALDQAGAYIQETESRLSDYFSLYQIQDAELLKKRGDNTVDHPDSVMTTFSLSFKKIFRANPAAIELLRLFAFLHPDAIPEEIVTEGAPDLGSILQRVAADPEKLNSALKELFRYSLVHRNIETGTFSLHRLVQIVLQSNMNDDTQRRWAVRAVRVVSRVFEDPQFTRWQRYHLYAPHAQVCAVWIEKWEMIFPEAERLLMNAGTYLQDTNQYVEAEPLYRQVRELHLQRPQPGAHEGAMDLIRIASLYYAQGKYAEAEPLLQRALKINKQVLGADHPDTALSFNNLATLYWAQGKYEQAEPLFQRALAICERTLGPQHPTTQTIRANYARLLRTMGHDAEAAALNQP